MAIYNDKTMLHTYQGADPVITYDHISENSQNPNRAQSVKKTNFTTFVLEELFLIAMVITCLYLYF